MTPAEITAKQIELLKWEIANRNSANRSVTILETEPPQPACLYAPSEASPGCAIGRLLPLLLAQQFDTLAGSSQYPSGAMVSTNEIFDALPAEVAELGRDFLRDFQRLHDTTGNWDEKGLTWAGDSFIRNYFPTLYKEIRPL